MGAAPSGMAKDREYPEVSTAVDLSNSLADLSSSLPDPDKGPGSVSCCSGCCNSSWPLASSTPFTPVMKVLDAPSRRRVQKAASVEDLRIAAEKRMHAMCYGYLAGGADEEVALRRSVDCYKDVELRHAVLHGVGHGEVDPSTTILGHEAKLPFFVTSCAGFDAASFW